MHRARNQGAMDGEIFHWTSGGMADATDLGSVPRGCGFDSRLVHHESLDREFGPSEKTGATFMCAPVVSRHGGVRVRVPFGGRFARDWR